MASRTLKIVCAISILLNIFLFGAAVGGAAWLHARRPALGGIRFAGAKLPEDQRRAFHGALRDARMEMQPEIEDGRQARLDAAALLRARVLDRPALEAALARMRAADFAIREHVEQRAVATAAAFPPTDRAILAEGMARKPGRLR